MNEPYVSSRLLPEFPLWDKMRRHGRLVSFDLEVTARCNLDCRHCYINLPAGDREAKRRELTAMEIAGLAGDAASLGALWCLVSGGEPLLREDFFDIYLALKKKGLLLSVFTNATLIRDEHIRFFKKYPPREIEITVYGATASTYEAVTRKPGSFRAFLNGLDMLGKGGIKTRLKAMALRSNIAEWSRIASFCRERNKDYFRFDPFLHLRYDRDPRRNAEIRGERLSPAEIVELERADPERFAALEKNCDRLIDEGFEHLDCGHLFHCSAGARNFTIGDNGVFRLCSALCHPDCVYDLRKGSLSEAWEKFVPAVRGMKSDRKEFRENCLKCPIINLCTWCAAHAHLETGELDGSVDYFCQVAHERANALGGLTRKK
ncbi:MAG: radical SAM protein [Acidobacteriota bacterium]|nr:radical SAM protein [Acidobacteriota bacterium]